LYREKPKGNLPWIFFYVKGKNGKAQTMENATRLKSIPYKGSRDVASGKANNLLNDGSTLDRQGSEVSSNRTTI